jgi:lipopolysaccharide/colanic/teichoic acid biosynthesis glycosyltransferase
MYLIGSNSIHTSGDLYILDLNTISATKNKRQKRLFDFVSAFCMAVMLPVLFVVSGFKIRLFKNVFSVLFGKKTWVGYIRSVNDLNSKYPKIKKWIIELSDSEKDISPEIIHKLNLIYAKDYTVSRDISIFFKRFKKIWS